MDEDTKTEIKELVKTVIQEQQRDEAEIRPLEIKKEKVLNLITDPRGEKFLELEVFDDKIAVRERIQGRGKKRIGDYDIAVNELKNKEEIEISIIETEILDEVTKRTVSPEEGRVCFNFKNLEADPEDTAVDEPTTKVRGRRLRKGTIKPEKDQDETKVKFKFGKFEDKFKLKKGQNFFVVVKKERKGERAVARN